MMLLSREKIVRMSHQITEVLVASDEVEFIDDRDTIRQQIVSILTALVKEEAPAVDRWSHITFLVSPRTGQFGPSGRTLGNAPCA